MSKTAVGRYAYINAKLRTRLSSILSDNFTDALIHSADISEAVKIVADSGYQGVAEVWQNTADIQLVEFELFKKLIHEYILILKNTEEEVSDFCSVLLYKPEIENLKNTVRLWYGSHIKGRPIEYRSGYIYKKKIHEDINWLSIINAESFGDIKDILSKTAYGSIFSSKNDDINRKSGLFEFETALDRFYYKSLIEASKQLPSRDSEIVRDITRTEIDLLNISWLVRYTHFYKLQTEDLRNILLPGGHDLNADLINNFIKGDTDKLNPAELLSRSYPELSRINISENRNFSSQAMLFEKLLSETRKRYFTSILAGYPFTIGTVLVFLSMVEREVKFISSVLSGKYYKLNDDKFREFL